MLRNTSARRGSSLFFTPSTTPIYSVIGSQRIYAVPGLCSRYLSSTPLSGKKERKFGFIEIAALTGAAVGVGVLVKPFLEPREQRIFTNPTDMEHEETHAIVDSNHYKKKKRTEHGSLRAKIMKDQDSGRHYVKKGAHSKETLIKEFFISNMLAILDPGIQPESLLMQRVNGDTAQFFTMSRKYKNSMDLEQFIRQPDWREKLQQKPLIGLDIALAKDSMLAKQQDMKFQNLIVVETPTAYVVSSIDHELAGESFYRALNHTRFSLEIDSMIMSIRDLHDPKDPDFPGNIGGLTGDPVGREFIEAVRKDMDERNILEYYKRFANADFQPLIDLLEMISKENSSLISMRDCRKYEKFIANLQNKAKIFVAENELFYTKEAPSLK